LSQTSQALGRTRGEPEAEASRLYHEYHGKLLRYCVGQLRSREEAEDAVQNTFLRVFTALRKGVVPEYEGPWLYKIAHNVCLSKRLGSSRRARVETPVDLDVLGDRAAAYSADADELFGLDDALADMPANLRRPLLMREWQGMSYAEIADALGVSHSAVETLIFRARRHLASSLTNSGKAIASVFNIRWLFNLLKGFGGGVGSAGMAAGAAGLVVAIGGGVAIDLATQSASASHREAGSVSAGALAAERMSSTATAQGAPRGDATPHGVFAQGTATRGSTGARKTEKGAPGSSSGGAAAGGASTSGSSGSSSSATAPSSTKPSSSSHPSGSASSGRSASGSGTKGSKPKGSGSGSGLLPGVTPPSVPDPGGVLPPATIPSVPPVPPVAPPALPPPPPLPSPPTINLPGNLVAEATGAAGAVVAYTVTATDVADGTDPVTCAPMSGSMFHLGHTTVSCSSTDKAGSTSTASFDVLVRDTTAPSLTVPSDITVKSLLKSGVKVTYTATASDLVDPAPTVTCNPASGSLFLIGTTTVTCTATDSAGNSSSKKFTVTVTL